MKNYKTKYINWKKNYAMNKSLIGLLFICIILCANNVVYGQTKKTCDELLSEANKNMDNKAYKKAKELYKHIKENCGKYYDDKYVDNINKKIEECSLKLLPAPPSKPNKPIRKEPTKPKKEYSLNLLVYVNSLQKESSKIDATDYFFEGARLSNDTIVYYYALGDNRCKNSKEQHLRLDCENTIGEEYLKTFIEEEIFLEYKRRCIEKDIVFLFTPKDLVEKYNILSTEKNLKKEIEKTENETKNQKYRELLENN